MSPNGGPGVSISIEAQNRASAAFRSFQADLQNAQGGIAGLNRSNAALATGAADSQRATEAFRRSLGVTGAELRNATLTSERLVESQRRFERQVIRGDRSLDDLHDNMRGGRRTLSDYARGVGNVHIQFVALGIANRALQSALQSTVVAQGRAAVQLERLQVGLGAISGGVQEATEQYQRLIEVSRLPGINLENALRSSLQLQAIGESGERAAQVIGEFGNALALSGQSASELRRVVEGLRQISGEGKILQEDIAIITARVAALVPGLREAFGGTRAEDIRRTYDALGIAPSDQGKRFIEDVLGILRQLPRAGNTAANSLENLFDTADRAQAAIGRSFLPLIREATSALEEFLQQIERDPDLARQIAQFEAFAGTLGTVALGIAGVGAVLHIVGPGIVAAFTHPVGLAALGLGVLAAAIVTVKVSAEEAIGPNDRLRQVIEDYNATLADSVAARDRLTEAIEKHSRALETHRLAQEAVAEAERVLANTSGDAADATRVLAAARAELNRRTKDLEDAEKGVETATQGSEAAQRQAAEAGAKQIDTIREALEAERKAVADLEAEYAALDEQRRVFLSDPEANRRRIVPGFLGTEDVQVLPSRVDENVARRLEIQDEELPQARTRIGILETQLESAEQRFGDTSDAADEASEKVTESVSTHITSLTQVADQGASAIARTLQELDNFEIGGGGGQGGPGDDEQAQQRQLDLAYDIGNELIRITEATTVAQVNASQKRVEAYARDNSLIVEGEQTLQALITAVYEQASARRSQLFAVDLRVRAREQEAEREQELITTVRDAFVAAEQSKNLETLQTHRQALQAVQERFDREREITGEAGRLEQRRGTLVVQAEQRLNRAILPLALERQRQQALVEDDITKLVRRGAERRQQILEEAIQLNNQLGEAETEGEAQRIARRAGALLDGLDTESAATREQVDALTLLREEAQAKAAELARGELIIRAQQEFIKRSLDLTLQYVEARTALLDAANQQELNAAIRTLEGLQRRLQSDVDLAESGAEEFAPAISLDRDIREDIEDATDALGELEREQDRVNGVIRNLNRNRSFESQQQVIAETRVVVQELNRRGTLYEGLADKVRDATDRSQERLRESVEQGFARIQRQAEDALSVEQVRRVIRELDQFSDSVDELGHGFRDVQNEVSILGSTLEESLQSARVREFVGEIGDEFARAGENLFSNTLEYGLDRAIGFFFGNIDERLEDLNVRISRLGEDAEIRLSRLRESFSDRRENLLLQRRRLLASRRPGDQQAFERLQDRLAENSQRLAQLNETQERRETQLEDDRALRERRLREDFERLRDRQPGFLAQLGEAAKNALINIAGDTASSIVGDTIKNIFEDDGDGDGTGQGRGDGDSDGKGDTSSTPSLTAPTESLDILTHSTPTLTAPVEPLTVLTHSTPTLAAPTESLEVLTHSTPTLNLPDKLDLSSVPVTQPSVVLEVDTPETIDLSTLQYTNIPKADIPITDPELLDPVDFGGLRYANITPVEIPVNTPENVDLSGLQYQNIPNVDIPINTEFNPIDFGNLVYQNIPNVDIPITDPAQLDPIDLSDLEYENIPEVPIELPDADLLDPVDLSGLRYSNVPDLPLGTPDTIDLSGTNVILPAVFDGISSGSPVGDDNTGGTTNQGTGQGSGIDSQRDGGGGNPALFEERERQHRLFRPPPQESGVTHGQLTEGLINRPRTGGNPLSLDRILDGFNRLIEGGLSGLPDFLEPFAREIAAQGVGVSTDGGQTYLTTADGTRIATLSQDEDSGETTIAALPDTPVGGETTGTDDSSTETTSTTVRIGGGDPGRPGVTPALIDPQDYLVGLEDAVAGQLTPDALSDAVQSAILNPNQPGVFEATISPNQIVITPQTPEFEPTPATEPLIPNFQRPTLTRRPPDPTVVEVDYGTLFSGATGDFRGGEGALERLVYFLSGIELPDQPAPVPEDDDDENVARAPAAIPQPAPTEQPTIDLSELKLNELGILTNSLLGELVNVSAQQFEVQASILEASAAAQQSINLLTVSQLPVINSLASIDMTLASIPPILDAIRIGTQQIADTPLVNQLIDAGFQFPQTPAEQTAFPDVLSQGGINLLLAFTNLGQHLDAVSGPGMEINPALEPLPSDVANEFRQALTEVTINTMIVNKTIDVNVVGGKLDVSGSSVESTPAPGSVQNVSVQDVIRTFIEGGFVSVDNTVGVEVLNQVAVAFGFGGLDALADALAQNNPERVQNNQANLIDS